jgi:hypothetical protein
MVSHSHLKNKFVILSAATAPAMMKIHHRWDFSPLAAGITA